MSHLACPLCGLNAPLSKFDPSNLDLDVIIKAFGGLGRAKGFACVSADSVLGDDLYSPMIFNRIANLCAMFLKEGSAPPDACLFAKSWAAEKAKPRLTVPAAPATPTWRDNYETRLLKDKITELETLLKVNYYVEWALGCIMQNSDFNIIIDEEVPWILEIREVNNEFFKDIWDYFEPLSDPMRQQLRKRVKTRDERLNVILEEFLFKSPPRKKSVIERMLDWDPSSGEPLPK